LPYNPKSSTLHAGSAVILRRDGDLQERRVAAVRPHKRLLLLTLDDCSTMSAAEELVGCEVCVYENDLPTLSGDEIYHYQLIGMKVVTVDGDTLGEVFEVMALPSNDICVVRGGGKEHLIPLSANVVREVDRQQRRIVIAPLAGLLDI
jgi:16S rRNA processing protein RimM